MYPSLFYTWLYFSCKKKIVRIIPEHLSEIVFCCTKTFLLFYRPAAEEIAPKTEDSVTQNTVHRIPNLERVTLPFYEYPATKTTIFKG
jgi:hypothetical protein